MFFAQDAFGERVRRVAILDWHHGLHHNRPRVQILVHEMHGAARKFRAVLQRLALRFKSRKRGQERRVNIQNALRKRGHKIRRKQPHVASEANEVHVFLLQRRNHKLVVRFALQALRGNCARLDSAGARLLDSLRGFPVAHHNRDFGVGNAPRGHTGRQRVRIRAAPRKQHADVLFHE